MITTCTIKSRRLRSHKRVVARLTSKVNWPSFDGHAQFVGTTSSGRVKVFVDASLGPQALQNAKDLLADADRIIGFNDRVFGTNAGNVNVILFALSGATDGSGGADHMGCDYATGQNIEVCVSYGEPMRCSGLFEAELSECAMNDNLCGFSTGEALSRWCATIVSNNALSDFATAPTWLFNGAPDFVTITDPTDQSADSTGCGMAFISWLVSLGHRLPKIAQTMVELGDSGTLDALYFAVGETVPSFVRFKDALAALPGGVQDDDPFGAIAKIHHQQARRRFRRRHRK